MKEWTADAMEAAEQDTAGNRLSNGNSSIRGKTSTFLRAKKIAMHFFKRILAICALRTLVSIAWAASETTQAASDTARAASETTRAPS